MDEQEKREFRITELKRRLIKVCTKINKAHKGAIDVLRSNPSINLRLLDRYSGVVKDPSPLATTMGTFGMKYPIIARADRLGFLTPDEREEYVNKADLRIRDTVRVKKSLVDKWLDSDKSTPEGTSLDCLEVLYRQPRAAVDSYNAVEWEKSNIYAGLTTPRVEALVTRKPLVDVLPSERKSVVVELLCPEMSGRIDDVPLISDEVRNKLKMQIPSGLPLDSQASVLMSAMDPAIRHLPSSGVISYESAEMVHALATNTWVIKEDTVRDSDRSMEVMIKKVASAIFLATKELGLDDRRRAVEQTTVNSMDFRKLLATVGDHDNFYVKYCKTAVSMPIRNDCRSGSTNFSVETGSTVPLRVSNSNCCFNIYKNRESVYFSNASCKGTFVHDGPSISQITLTWSDRRKIVSTLSDIANYCRWGWIMSEGKTVSKIALEVRKRIISKPWSIIEAGLESWNTFMLSIPKVTNSAISLRGALGSITIVPEIGSPTIVSKIFHFQGTRLVYLDEQNKEVERIEPPGNDPEKPELPYAVDSRDLHVIPYLCFNRCFYRTFFYKYNCLKDKMERASDKKFYNAHMRSFVNPNYKRIRIQKAARVSATFITSPISLAFILMWTNLTEEDDLPSVRPLTDWTYGGQKISINMSQGTILEHNPLSKEFRIFGSVIKNSEKFERLITTPFSGVRVQPSSRISSSTVFEALKFLEDKVDGTETVGSHGGFSYRLTRDRRMHDRAVGTIAKGMQSVSTQRKRKNEELLDATVKRFRSGF